MIQYSGNYFMTSENLWKLFPGNCMANNDKTTKSRCFKYNIKVIKKPN